MQSYLTHAKGSKDSGVIFHGQHTTPGGLTGQLPVLVGVLCRNQKENILWDLQYNRSGFNRRNLHYFSTQHHTFSFCRIHKSGLSKKQKVHQAHMASEAAQHEVPAPQSALQSKGIFFPSLFISSAPALVFKEKEIDKERKNKTTTPRKQVTKLSSLSYALKQTWSAVSFGLGPASLPSN